MSCSKIFSGELPELTYDILKYFKNDFSTLHSCILVNRLWCRLAIPLLWENPFSKPTGNYKFIEICLDNLNGDLKTELNEYRIEDNLIPSNTLFNYPSFIRYLNTHTIFYSIYKWSEIAKKTLKPEKRNLHEVKNFQKLIQILFFKLIIDNEANLHTLKIELISSTWNSHFNNLLELILQNPNFIIHNVKNLTFYTRIHNDSTSDNTYMIAKNLILQLINLHQNLKNISLSFDINFLSYKSLLLTKDYNCSNTLNTITLYSRSQIDDSSFQLLLRKCGGYLENFGNLIENMKQSLNYLTIIVSNCENYIECSSIILQNLGQVLPFKLEYLDLVLHIKMSDFEVFLKNSQDTFIKKLLINNFNDLKGQDILSYIKEYIMKKKRAKYLAFMYSYESTSDDEDIENYKELASMKDEVEEFKLYGIKLLSYYGSLISFYEFTRD
ncbi:unnamed protein product [Rhizophagus irregularis]|nr:unnamed protein product [Rhizophagus irregularis]